MSTLLLGLLDYWTGYELSISLFYLLPICLATWTLGRSAGILTSALSTVIWHLASDLAGQPSSHPLIPYWNALIRLGFFLVVTFLLTGLREVLAREQALAQRDFLTGTYNARAFYARADHELLRLQRDQQPLSMLYLDLDNFKGINDHYGHATGDMVLARVGQILMQNVRSTDIVARIGDDEFVILMPRAAPTLSQEIVQRVEAALLREMQYNNWDVTLSMGVLTCLIPPASVDKFIELADSLMYEAKNGGKNQVRYATLKSVASSPVHS